MFPILKRHLAAACLAVSLPAAAASNGVDYTDMWWAGQQEHGWGVNMTQQGSVIFATLYVYAQDQTPRWYAATMQGSGGAFSGPMYSTTGNYFGGGFSGDNTVATQVGTMTVNFNSPYSGTVQYTVNGVSVTKGIVRETFAPNDLSGHYVGGLTANGTNCHGVTNGPIFIFDSLTVAQSGASLSMTVDFTTGSGSQRCTFTGALAGQGVLGQVSGGNWSCTTSNAGSYSIDAIHITQSGFSGTFSGADQFCSYSGFFGGVRDVQ
ncbi:MAG TPA: hypothetical protein VLT89_14100 [Usitatibacter sp.]|nr:hypothetical protein [Usitatibacter sp.]